MKTGAIYLAAGLAAFAFIALTPMTRDIVRAHIGGISEDYATVQRMLGDRRESDEGQKRLEGLRAQGRESGGLTCQAAAELLPSAQDKPSLSPAERQKVQMAILERVRRIPHERGQRPEFYAILLRHAAGSVFRLRRDTEENLVNPQGIRDPYAYTPPEIGSSAEAIRNFETDAERGAAADPDNAFFPAMQAASLLMQDRDDEAIAALHQAALRPLFRVYVNAEFQGAVRLIESRQKRAMPALLEETVAVAASMSMPDYGTVRTLSQVMVGLALEKEMCGDRKRGLAIRKDIARLGATMRATCDYAIGSEIGVAVTEVAAIDRLDPPFYDFSEDEEKAMMLRGYLASLRAEHQDSEACWYAAERERGAAVVQILRDAGYWAFGDLRAFYYDVIGWIAGGVLLTTAFLTLGVGGAVSLSARRRSFLSDARAKRRSAVLIALLCALSVVGFCHFGAALPGYWGFLSIPGGALFGDPELGQGVAGLTLPHFVQCFLSLLPLTFVIGVALIVRVRRSRLSFLQYAARLLPQDALRTAGILLLVYVAVALALTCLEYRERLRLYDAIQHPGQQEARSLGCEWPGPSNPPPLNLRLNPSQERDAP